MNDLRQAAQQALEALEGWDNYGKWVWPESALEQAKRNTTEAITALRAALEQQAEPTPPDAAAGLVDDLCLLHMGWKTDAEDDLYRAAWGRVIARAKQLKAQVGKGEKK